MEYTTQKAMHAAPNMRNLPNLGASAPIAAYCTEKYRSSACERSPKLTIACCGNTAEATRTRAPLR